jgi:hypothetical protein
VIAAVSMPSLGRRRSWWNLPSSRRILSFTKNQREVGRRCPTAPQLENKLAQPLLHRFGPSSSIAHFHQKFHTSDNPSRAATPVGVEYLFRLTPNVAAARQRWAGGRRPLGASKRTVAMPIGLLSTADFNFSDGRAKRRRGRDRVPVKKVARALVQFEHRPVGACRRGLNFQGGQFIYPDNALIG